MEAVSLPPVRRLPQQEFTSSLVITVGHENCCGDTWFPLISPRFYVLTSCVSCKKTLLTTVYSN